MEIPDIAANIAAMPIDYESISLTQLPKITYVTGIGMTARQRRRHEATRKKKGRR